MFKIDDGYGRPTLFGMLLPMMMTVLITLAVLFMYAQSKGYLYWIDGNFVLDVHIVLVKSDNDQPVQVQIGVPFHFGHINDNGGPLTCQKGTKTSHLVILQFKDQSITLRANKDGFTDDSSGSESQNDRTNITMFEGWDPYIEMKQAWATICYDELGRIGVNVSYNELPQMK